MSYVSGLKGGYAIHLLTRFRAVRLVRPNFLLCLCFNSFRTPTGILADASLLSLFNPTFGSDFMLNGWLILRSLLPGSLGPLGGPLNSIGIATH